MVLKDPKFWMRQLDLADKEERKYRERAKKTWETYRGETEKAGPSRFNILWSNTQVQLPAMYSARPKPDVRRRHKTEDPIGREISIVLERAFEWSMDSGYDFDRLADKLVLDFLIPGRMVARARYHPFFQTKEREEFVLEEPIPGERQSVEETDEGFLLKTEFDDLIAEEVRNYHVPWDKYRQSPADCWTDVWWVAYGNNFLTKEEIQEQFGLDDVPLNFSDNEEDKEEDNQRMTAQVWEIWDKEDKKVYAVVKGYDDFLMEVDDPLKLKDFYPQPEPALMIEDDGLIPTPEYTMYQFQAEELNEVSERIARLAKAMKAKGFYPGEDAAKMEDLLKSDENILVPVDSWAAHAEKGGIAGLIDWMPIKEIADVWQRLIVQRNGIIQSIYELIGISDIQRGASDPRETKGAQQLKANFGGRRLLPKTQRFQRFIRNLLRINAEIMSEHFSDKTLSQISGEQVTAEMTVVMKSDVLRSFSIDIETDSTVAPDDEKDKAGAAEFLTAMSNFLAQSLPVVQAQPEAVVPLGKMLLWMSRKFKIARDVEQEIEDFIKAMSKAPQRANDESEAKRAESQAKQQETQQKLQLMAQEKQMKLQLEERESENEDARKNRELEAEIRRKDFETQADIRRKDIEANADVRRDDRKEKNETTKEGNVTPISKNFRLVRDGDTITGAEMEEGGITRKLTFQRDKNGNVTGGEVGA